MVGLGMMLLVACWKVFSRNNDRFQLGRDSATGKASTYHQSTTLAWRPSEALIHKDHGKMHFRFSCIFEQMCYCNVLQDSIVCAGT